MPWILTALGDYVSTFSRVGKKISVITETPKGVRNQAILPSTGIYNMTISITKDLLLWRIKMISQKNKYLATFLSEVKQVSPWLQSDELSGLKLEGKRYSSALRPVSFPQDFLALPPWDGTTHDFLLFLPQKGFWETNASAYQRWKEEKITVGQKICLYSLFYKTQNFQTPLF